MRRDNTSQFAILGLLTVEPMSGYDLRKHFQESLVYFWNESYGRIYPTLKALAAEGLVKPSDASRGKRDRQIHSLTTKGRSALREWLDKAPQRQPPRNEFLLKLFLANSAPPGTLLRHLKRYRSQQEQLLAMYMIIRDSVRQEHVGSSNLCFWMLGLDHGMRICRAEIDWCNDASRVLHKERRSEHSAKGALPQREQSANRRRRPGGP